MVFFAPYEKLDQRKKIVKQLKKVAVLLDASELSERDETIHQGLFTFANNMAFKKALNTLLLKTQYTRLPLV